MLCVNFFWLSGSQFFWVASLNILLCCYAVSVLLGCHSVSVLLRCYLASFLPVYYAVSIDTNLNGVISQKS